MATVSMILGVASLCGSFVTGVPAVILGVLSLRSIRRSQGRLKGKGVAIAGLVFGLFGSVVPILVVREVQYRANRLISFNNLYQMGLAMHSYASANGTFPPAAVCDANGKPLLSCRVALLPYINEGRLYQQFKLDEPWDGPNNSKLLPLMPKCYAFPGDTTAPPGNTYYRVFVGNGAAFDPPRPSGPNGETPGIPLSDFTDGTGNTILIVEAATRALDEAGILGLRPRWPIAAAGRSFQRRFPGGDGRRLAAHDLQKRQPADAAGGDHALRQRCAGAGLVSAADKTASRLALPNGDAAGCASIPWVTFA